MAAETVALLVLVPLLVAAGFAVAFWRLRSSMPALLEEARTAGVAAFKKHSGRTRLGNTVEHYVPFLEDFPFDPSDARLISGGPVDYVIFDGLTEGRVRAVVFVDVKTGMGKLSSVQKQVRDCVVRGGRVDFIEFHVDNVAERRQEIWR